MSTPIFDEINRVQQTAYQAGYLRGQIETIERLAKMINEVKTPTQQVKKLLTDVRAMIANLQRVQPPK